MRERGRHEVKRRHLEVGGGGDRTQQGRAGNWGGDGRWGGKGEPRSLSAPVGALPQMDFLTPA